MQSDLLSQAAAFLLEKRRKNRWYKVVSCLAMVVVFCTTYALILPAITMEHDTICGLEEHTHTEDCYRTDILYPQASMNCAMETLGVHAHDGSCYDGSGNLICGYSDFVVHTHDETCYREDGSLICTLPEVQTHTHTASCYTEVETLICQEEEDLGHTHTDTCSKRLRGDLICMEEEKEGHAHTDACYETVRELTCGSEEEGHEHGESCYTERQELVCGQNDDQGHRHTDDCYEWTAELICTQEEREPGHVHGEACYQIDQVLTCDRDEVALHSHDDDCFSDDGSLICGKLEIQRHQHTDECIQSPPEDAEPEEVTVLVCGMEEHTHTEDCYEMEEPSAPGEEEPPETEIPQGETYLCGQTEHTHDEACLGEDGELICGLEEHSHGLECLTPEKRTQIEEIAALIDELPSSEEIDAAMSAYDEVGDDESCEAYFTEISQQVRDVYARYEALEPDLREMVPNRDKLLELEWIWSAATLEIPVGAVTVKDQAALESAVKAGKAYILLGQGFTVNSALTVPTGKEITLDLNGHTLTATGTLFTVPSGTSLTIVDSRQNAGTVTNVSGNLAGNTASLLNNVLTYYVTTTSITNDATGATKEALEKHTVTASGAIKGGNQPVFRVTGGTLTIQSGMIHGGTNRAIEQTNGTTNFEGGYICGFTRSSTSTTDTNAFGGAARVSGGTLNLSGGVLAVNTAHNGGGIYATGSANISITGGAVSGNTANRAPSGWNDHSESGAYRCGGGGIYADVNAEITMSGGYITNNAATHKGYFDGGGGVCLSGTSTMELSGGYVTGNKAQGGGGIRTDFGKKTTFKMTGGFVSANVATEAEGGGVAIDRDGVGTITGGYITNNQIPETGHWGGGGLFCADGSTLNLKNTLITENTAGGFGAGVAGCPTGQLYLYVTEGCAIYDNIDTVDGDSPHFTSDGVKQVDKEICTEVFQSNGHADYFCALNSTVTGTMLGNNAANWQGSADYKPVIADAEDLLSATRVMGLQAHPTEGGKKAAEAAAKVYINGNYSYTHGGGIMCNGNLVIGVPVNIEVPARVELQATKRLENQNGGAVSMEDNDFSFRVTMTEVDGRVIAKGVCDNKGNITFDHQLTFKQEGTFVYYVYEEADGGNPSVKYDPTLYRLTVTVKKDNGVPWYGDTIKYTYSVTSIKVESSVDGKTWTQVSKSDTSQSGVITLPLTSGATFTNRVTEVTKLTVRKEWADGTPGTDSVTVILKKDGEDVERQTLNADNKWSYTWTNLEAGHSYTVEEEEVPGYTPSYQVTTGEDNSDSISLGQGSWWVPATELKAGQKYLIVSPDGAKALRVASGNEGQGFDTADTANVLQQQKAIKVDGQTYSTWYQAADIPARSIYNAEALTRNSHSGVILKRSDGDSFPYLRLESNNNNYLKGGSSTTYASFMVFDGTYLKGHNASEWTPNNLRTVIFENGKFNTTTNQNPANAAKLYTLVSGEGFTSGSSGNSTVVITNTRDASADYELPETGGPGTSLYTLGGLCLMAGALLLYRSQTRRKGGRD